MKIGFFTDTYLPQINGVTFTVKQWKKELEKRGHEVFIYYPKDENYKPADHEVPLPSFPFIFYKGYHIGLPSFKNIEKDFDIVHLHGFVTMAALGLAVARKQRIPAVLTYHTPPDFYLQQITSNEFVQESLRVVYYKYEQEFLERCDLVTAPSEGIIKMLKARLGDKIKRTISFSNGIDTNFFKAVDGEKFRKDYKIPKGRVIGYTGRHSAEKHLEDLINFADQFDGTILLGGDGQQNAKYQEMAKGKDNVRFLGFFDRNRLPEFYSLLDIFGMPSTAETEGLVVLEANACGAPAVGANAMALKTTIQDDVNGYHYEPGDTKDLAKKVEMAYKNMKRLRASSKEYVKERSVAKTAKKLEGIYKELIEEYKNKR